MRHGAHGGIAHTSATSVREVPRPLLGGVVARIGALVVAMIDAAEVVFRLLLATFLDAPSVCRIVVVVGAFDGATIFARATVAGRASAGLFVYFVAKSLIALPLAATSSPPVPSSTS